MDFFPEPHISINILVFEAPLEFPIPSVGGGGGGMDIFIIFSLSSKTKLCCFCQILCQILTNEILQTAGMNVGRITVIFFFCVCIF